MSLGGLVLAGPPASQASAGASGPATIVRLTAAAACAESVGLSEAGATQVDGKLRLWRLGPSPARTLLPALEKRGAVSFTEPERHYRVAASTETADPFQPDEWWRSQVGIDGVTPPGPGIPVTVVDSGVDIDHPEFAGRPDTVALNPQEPAGYGGHHGTMVASVIAAPANGIGALGIYPQALLRSWDIAIGAGNELSTTEIVSGVLAAARAGRGVINLSVGGNVPERATELAIEEAVGLGSLVVAASGNDGDRGSPVGYPASYPHVLTVAATGKNGAVTSFSSRSAYVDLAAPGEDIVVATPDVRSGEIVLAAAPSVAPTWVFADGTSFSTPLVAGAAAWLWTVRPNLQADQVAEILRRSAKDFGAPGRDRESGFGMLNVAAALSYATPVRDASEPNDDVDEIDPNGDRYFGKQPAFTTKSKQRVRQAGRIDRYEDPRDVFRVWLPAKRTVTVALTSSTDGNLALFGDGANTVVGRFAAKFQLARAETKGTAERLTYRNTKAGRWAYLAVSLPNGTVDATYSVSVTSK
jgi:subtilisin family serine protease